jgi:hypothetical protein
MSEDDGRATFYRIIVAVETDATRYYGPEASRPALLGKSQAEQLLAHLAADLQALLPDVSRCSLIAAGALFDQTQVLRPGYPLFTALEATAAEGGPGRFRPGLVSIGATGGAMPLKALQPQDDIPLGMLQVLPVVLHGPGALVDELGGSMEYRFLEEGQLSPHSAAWLSSAFGIDVNHARLMTLTDLNALLRLQLEHFGFLPLWELLDAALTEREDRLTVTTPLGQVYHWRDGAVHTEFETFDYWANLGGGAERPAARLALADAYGERIREIRQYMTTLSAHGLSVHFRLPGADAPLEDSFLVESGDATADPSHAVVTEHSLHGTGTLAITVVRDGRIEHYYPLDPRGLNDIHACLRARIPGGQTVSFPGTVVYDEHSRRLQPDTTANPSAD